jgi:hypothetical protein
VTTDRAHNSAPDEVLTLVREKGADGVFAAMNCSDARQRVTFDARLCDGTYIDELTGQPVTLGAAHPLQLEPWGYRVRA